MQKTEALDASLKLKKDDLIASNEWQDTFVSTQGKKAQPTWEST